MNYRLACCTFLTLTLTLFASAQGGKSPNRGGASPTTSTGSSVNTTPSSTPPGPGASQRAFISGKVVLEDGSKITEPASILTICRGRKQTVTNTDSHGNFSFDFGGGVGILFGEAFDAACGVNQLLFAGEEGVAIGADFDFEHVALDGRAGGEIVAAGAVNGDGVIVGMNTGFHEAPFCRVRSARPPQQGRGTTAASLGREAILDHTRSVKFCQMEG